MVGEWWGGGWPLGSRPRRAAESGARPPAPTPTPPFVQAFLLFLVYTLLACALGAGLLIAAFVRALRGGGGGVGREAESH